MSSLLLSLLGWTFVPDFITTQLVTRVLKGPSNRKHYAVTFSLVILAYLSYTLFQSSREIEPNFYQILDVHPNVDESGLKLAFRTFAKRNHPDRRKDGENVFIMVRDAYEALKDPSVRSAYDRFGPQALEWRKTCSTTRDFVYQGLVASSGYHIVALISLLFLGHSSPVSFWRFLLFFIFFGTELAYVLSPNDTFLLSILFPNRVAYQHVRFLHQLFLFCSVALTRVVPKFAFLFPQQQEMDPNQRTILEAILGTLNIADRESSLIVHTLLTSISPQPNDTYHQPTLARMSPLSPTDTFSLLDSLSPEMEHLVIEANIKNQPLANSPIGIACDAALSNSKNLAGKSLIDRLNPSRTIQSPPKTPLRRPTSRTFWENGERISRPSSPFAFGRSPSPVKYIDASPVRSSTNVLTNSNGSRPPSPVKRPSDL